MSTGGWGGWDSGSSVDVVTRDTPGTVEGSPFLRVWDCWAALDGAQVGQSATLKAKAGDPSPSPAATFILTDEGVQLDGECEFDRLDAPAFVAVGPSYPVPAMEVITGTATFVAGGLELTDNPTDLWFPGFGDRLRYRCRVRSVFTIADNDVGNANAYAAGVRVIDPDGNRYGCGLWRSGANPNITYGRVQFDNGDAPTLGNPGATMSNEPPAGEVLATEVGFAWENSDNGTFDAGLAAGQVENTPGQVGGGVIKDELNINDQPNAPCHLWLYRQGPSFAIIIKKVEWRAR